MTTTASEQQEVDIIGEAYQNARAEGVQLRTGGAGYLKAIAPAKVNLYLGVGARQQNGYHTVQNIMHTLLIHDILYMRRLSFEAFAYETGIDYSKAGEGEAAGQQGEGEAAGQEARGQQAAGQQAVGQQKAQLAEASAAEAAGQQPLPLKIHLTCSGVGSLEIPSISAQENIVYKALVALARALGRNEDEVIDVHLEKHLPFQAGLGGGSSDAAAALMAAAKLWGVSADDARIEQVAKTLGADVAFFLRGGCALYNGAGENYVHSLATNNAPVALIKPPAGLSTAAVYRAFDEAPHLPTREQEAAALNAKTACDVPLFNGLEQAAGHLDPTLAEIHAWANAQPGVERAMLTGSGSCTFAVCESSAAALKIAAAAQARGWWATSTYFANARAAVGK